MFPAFAVVKFSGRRNISYQNTSYFDELMQPILFNS